MKIRTVLPVLGLGALLAGSPAVLAQNASPPPDTNLPPKVETRVQQHIEQLHKRLEITPAQQSQWDQFAQVMQQDAADMRSAIEQRGQELNSMTALQDMQSYTHLADVHAEDMHRLTAAFEQLYNSLTPQQRQNADEVFRYRAETRASRHGNAHG
jgi:periplasmic protein CpxP/Spy